MEPVAWLPALDGWLITRRDLALAAMRDAETFTVDDPRFSTGRVVGPSMLSRDGAEHDRHRAPFARPFRLEAVRSRFTARVASEVDALLDALEPRGAADLRAELAAPLAAAVVADALGLGHVRVDEVLGWYEAIVAAVTAVTAGEPLPESGRGGYAALRDAIAAEPLGALTADEVASNSAVLLFGGIETTEGMIATALLHLLSDAGALARVRADPSLLVNAVEESLRLEPAAATVDRYATRDVTVGGAQIAAGDLVTISISAANRDPATFEDPDAFVLDRPNAKRHLAFAAGPHVCIGMHLARLEAHTALARTLERLPDLRLDPAYPEPVVRGLVFRKPPALQVSWG